MGTIRGEFVHYTKEKAKLFFDIMRPKKLLTSHHTAAGLITDLNKGIDVDNCSQVLVHCPQS
jgi:hypothetical protein